MSKPIRVSREGYVVEYRPGHPNASKRGDLAQHRLVMSEKLGRPLRKGENVHHLDGHRANNDPNNLELWGMNQPPGQRVIDILDWCHAFIARYEPERQLLSPQARPPVRSDQGGERT